MDTIKRIKELIDQDSSAYGELFAAFEAIIIMDTHYSHIVQLEVLVRAFRLVKESDGNLLNSFIYIIAENTRTNHYRKDGEKFDDVYIVGKELFPTMSLLKDIKVLQ